jgi:hypothetical protein
MFYLIQLQKCILLHWILKGWGGSGGSDGGSDGRGGSDGEGGVMERGE